jgi:hypothetical protein
LIDLVSSRFIFKHVRYLCENMRIKVFEFHDTFHNAAVESLNFILSTFFILDILSTFIPGREIDLYVSFKAKWLKKVFVCETVGVHFRTYKEDKSLICSVSPDKAIPSTVTVIGTKHYLSYICI